MISFHIATNEAVQAACPNLDEREGKGFLGADLLGVELLPGCEAPTEGHKIGKQIEDLLTEARGLDDKLRQAARTRRSKLNNRKPPLEASQLAQKLAESDAKYVRDRTALWSRPVTLNMPEAPIEVKRV